MNLYCPGNLTQGTPTIKLKKCPRCGAEVELFSTDMKVDCPGCGLPVFNNVNSCAEYCSYAELCLGTETVQKLRARRKLLKERKDENANQDRTEDNQDR